MRILVALALAGMLSGCIARTAVDIVTLPVKAVGQGVDWATTSQEESDRNYGRAMRKKEAREGKELKQREKEERKRARRERDRYDD